MSKKVNTKFQIYALHWKKDLWHILKALIPCEVGQGEFLKSVRRRNLGKAMAEEESKLRTRQKTWNGEDRVEVL